jgi:cytochrome c2
MVAPNGAAAQSASAGAALFQEKGCSSCHSIGGRGGDFGPALDGVGKRYNAEWIFTWLKNPDAVKPGTQMPNLGLTDEERARLVFYLLEQSSGEQAPPAVAKASNGLVANPPDLNPASIENAYLETGTRKSYTDEQRHSLQDQIQTFIPPLLQPAFTQPSFVLPPGAARFGVTFRDVATIEESDFAGQMEFGARVVDMAVKRRFYDFDAFIGFDDNWTLRVTIPFSESSVNAALNPAFMTPITVFPQGSTLEIGDISLFAKKKFIDQGNFPFGVAGVASLSIPTGPNHERFDSRTTVTTPMGDMLLPLPALDENGAPIMGSGDGTFRRFANDGRLPSALQPGIGTFGGAFGLFATRITEDRSFFGRGAFHVGGLYEIRPSDDGVDPGDRWLAFATLVKPIVGDQLSIDLTYLAQHQQTDSYDGLFAVPDGMGGFVAMPRPPFTGGTTQFTAGSFIWSPNPLFRATLSGLYRISEPRLGPSPEYVIRFGITNTFATSLFQ